MEKNLENLEIYILYAVAFLVPISFLPLFPNFFVTTKLIILAAGVLLALLTKIARMIISGNFDVHVSNYDFPVFLLAVAYMVSSIVKTPNKMEAFFLPGTASIILFSIVYYFLVNQIKEKDKEGLLTVVFLSGIIVALSAFFGVTGILSKISALPAFMKNTAFTTLSGNIPAALYLTAIIPLGINFVITQKEMVKKTFFAISLGVVTLGLLINIYNVLPGKPSSPLFIGFPTSWFIAIDTLKESPFFGVGPGNYLTSFNRLRPLSYNQTPLWNIRFTEARDFYLTSITETGLIGMAALIILIFSVYKYTQKDLKERGLVGWNLMANSKLISLVLILMILAFFSSTIELILLTLLLLAVNAHTHKIELKFSTQPSGGSELTSQFAARLPAMLATLPIIAGVVALFVIGVKVVSAEAIFKSSLDALAANDGTKTYNLMQTAINKNPRVDRYHASLSQINLALADSIARKPEGVQVTDAERSTISQLIQQSINEGKAAVALNPQRSGNWELLGDLYRSIMAFAQGADAYAASSYTQAVGLDPVNPLVRLSLGGIYFAAKDYDNAIDVFKLAVLAKPDHANSHYNLAVAYREKGEIERAITEITAVLSLVDKNTPDYELVNKELADLEAKRPAKETVEGTENLTPPQGSGEPIVQPPLDLPEGAEPPSPEVSPTLTPAPTVEP